MHNAASEDHVKDMEDQLKRERMQELEDIKVILNLPAGLRFFKRLMDKGRIFQTTFTGNSQGMFLEGHRNLVLMFLDDIRIAAPEKVAELMIMKEE